MEEIDQESKQYRSGKSRNSSSSKSRIKVASGKVVENLEVVEEAEWRETRMVNSRGHNWPACWDQVGTGGEIDNEGRTILFPLEHLL